MTEHAGIKIIASLFLFSVIAVGSNAASSANNVTFGDKPTFQSDDKFDYQLSDDKKAFTIAFQGFEVTVGNKMPAGVPERARSATVSAPIGSRVLSLVIPVTGGRSFKTAFFASGFVLTTKGANATLVFSVNGKTTIARIPPDSNREIVQKLNYRAASVSDIRMTAFLLVERDSQFPDAAAFLGISTIDTDLALAKRGAAGKR